MIKSRLIRLLHLPVHMHLMAVLCLSILIFLAIKSVYLDGLNAHSDSIDVQTVKITNQLNIYKVNRGQIDQALSTAARLEQSMIELDKLLAMANVEAIESWLIGYTKANQIQPRQIVIKQNMSDELGEFFSINVHLNGSIKALQSFLEQTLKKNFFLIWEELIINQQVEDPSRLSIKMSFKRYFKLTDHA